MKKIIILMLTIISFSACRKPDPAPELRDPIYNDIQSQLKEAQGTIKEAQTDLKNTEIMLEKIVPYKGETKTNWNSYHKAKKKLRKANQQLHYLNIKLINRKFEARNSYIRAYNMEKEGEWPNPSQFYRYQRANRLKNASRDWDSRRIANDINALLDSEKNY
ncbi:MAG: hypothetical protein AB8E15_03465 [Bdellovibrionales bacterium]